MQQILQHSTPRQVRGVLLVPQAGEIERREALEAEKAAARAVLREAGIEPEAATQLPPQPLHAEEGHPPSPQAAAQPALGTTTTQGASAWGGRGRAWDWTR